MPVQPRACGEHGWAWLAVEHAVGSAPRLRGTLAEHAMGQIQQRFSPAPAGNTFSIKSAIEQFSVQPRACGEHLGSPCDCWF